MMELDQLKQQWAEHDRKLETSIRLNRQLAREVFTQRARSELLRLAAVLSLDATLLLATIIPLGLFFHNHLGMPRFIWPAVALEILAIGALVALNLQIALAMQTDYEKPITAIQKRLERLRTMRIRYAQGMFLAVMLAWTPAFIVGMEAFFGVDVYRTFGHAWVVSNLLLGLAIIPLAFWLARKYGDRISRSTFGRRLLDDIAGYNLNEATEFLATLARFEEEEF